MFAYEKASNEYNSCKLDDGAKRQTNVTIIFGINKYSYARHICKHSITNHYINTLFSLKSHAKRDSILNTGTKQLTYAKKKQNYAPIF